MSIVARGRFAHTKLVLSSSVVLIVHDGTADRTATLAAGTYFIRGDDVATAGQVDLLDALEDAINAAPSIGVVVAITQNLTAGSATLGYITITRVSGAATFNVKWNHASTTADTAVGPYLGFTATAATGLVTSATSEAQAAGLWFPDTEGSIRDNNGIKNRSVAVALSGATEVRLWGDGWDRYDVLYRYLPRTRIKAAHSATNVGADAGLLLDLTSGGDVLWWPDNGDLATVYRVVLERTDDRIAVHDLAVPVEEGATGEVYDLRLGLRDYVAA